MGAPSLSSEQVNDLAGVGLGMIWSAGVPENITAVQLAGQLLHRLAANTTTYNGQPILDIMRNSTRNMTLDVIAAEKILGSYALMPMNARHGLAAFWSLMIIFSGPMLALRLYSRLKYSGGLRGDDYFMVIAWLIATMGNINGIWLLVNQDFGAHGWNCTRKQLQWHYHLGEIDDMIVAIFSFFYKTALLIFFYDLYPHRLFRITCWIIGFIILFWATGFEVFSYYACSPWAHWKEPLKAKCIPQALAIYQAATILNIVIDVMIFALPCWVVYNLKVNLREKLQIIALMGVGLIVCIASILRYTTLNSWVHSADVQWRALDISTWCMLEPHLGILCACVPAVRKVVIHAIPKLKGFLSTHGIGSPQTTKQSPLSSAKSSTIGSALRPVGSKEQDKRPPRVGELTAIMNMKTDLESGLGTVIMHEDAGAADDTAGSKEKSEETTTALRPTESKESSSSSL